MPMLEGQVALVTGGAKRLGRAIAAALAAAGADVVVQYRNSEEEAEATVEELSSQGVKAEAVRAELADEGSVESMFAAIKQNFSRLDILVNNASHLEFEDWRQLTIPDWQAGLAPLTGALLCCRQAVAMMRAQGVGRIVNIADSASERFDPAPRSLPYRVAKNGIMTLTKTLAETETPHGITTNAVSPGTLFDSVTKPDMDAIPAARYAAYDDITNAVLFLLRRESGYISGANIKVTGGWDL